MTKNSEELSFETSDPEAKKYVANLATINEKLHSQLLKCQAENLSLKNRIKVLERELEEEREKPKLSDIVAGLQGSVLRPKTTDE